jgi:predicted glutamine amidotransferase
MCRLIGFAAPEPATLTELVGPEEVTRFRDMGRLHRDGWGTAWLDPALHPSPNGRGPHDPAPYDPSLHDPPPYRPALHDSAPYRPAPYGPASSNPAPYGPALRAHRATGLPDDAEFAALVESPPSVARLVHLRWATEGLEISERNSHPFVADGIALAHNGSISPRAELDDLLKPELLNSLVGTTDSERYLALVRQELPVAGEVSEAVARAVATLRREFPLASFNALILTVHVLIIVHASLGSVVPLAEMRARGHRDDELPLGHVDDYFQMYWRRGPRGSVLVTSTGIVNDGWEPLPPESVTTVELATMSVSQVQLVPQ